MPIEVATYLDDLNADYPDLNDDVEDGDDHIRLIKAVLKATFPNIAGVMHPTETQLNYLRYVDTTNLPVLATNIAGFAVGPFGGTHLSMGGAQIQAKSGTSAATLELNKLGGSVNIGPQAGSGQVNLYNAGGRTAFTETNGLGVRDNDGSLPAVNLYSQDTVALGQFIHSTSLYLQNLVDSSSFILTGRNAASATKIMFAASPLSNATLYYAGTPALTTTNIGGRVFPASGNDVYHEFFRADQATRNGFIGFTASGIELRQEVANQPVTLSSVITGGAVKTLLTGSPTGALSLYHAGVLKLSTTASGVILGSGADISPDASGTGQLAINGSGYTGYLTLDGTGMYFGHNSGSRLFSLRVNEVDGLIINPGGSVDLYHDGVKTFDTVAPATYSSGARVKTPAGDMYPVGYNGMPVISVGVSTPLRLANAGYWLAASAGITLDTTTNNAQNGAAWGIENVSGGSLPITPTGVTLRHLDGASGPTGTFYLAPYGYAVITKVETGGYRLIGVGISQ